MKRDQVRRHRRRGGLTLMELVVVMVILIALAGVLLPLFPSMLNRAHTSSSATSGTELSKAIQTYQALYYAYPSGLDNLVPTGSSNLFTKIATVFNTGTPNAYLTTVALSDGTSGGQNTFGALTAVMTNNASISPYVIPVVESTTLSANWSPTFFPYASTPIQPTNTATGSGILTLQNGTTVAALGPTSIINLGLIQGATYVVFGVGNYTTMSGKTMDDAPVHFDDNPVYSPNGAYARFGVVFQVADANGNALPQALYAGAVSFHDPGDGGVVGTDAHIAEYFNNISTSN